MVGGARRGLLIKPFSLFNDMRERTRAGATQISLPGAPFVPEFSWYTGRPNRLMAVFRLFRRFCTAG
jgi:hypothetical protein